VAFDSDPARAVIVANLLCANISKEDAQKIVEEYCRIIDKEIEMGVKRAEKPGPKPLNM